MKTIRQAEALRPHTLATAIALLASTVSVSPPVRAQDEQLMLEEIIVTARKRVETMQSVPIAVSAFSGEAIDSWIMRDIREMEGFVPNMVIDSVSVAPGGASFYIRGVGTQEVEKSFDPAVGVVVDGVPISIVNGTMINTFDFASMEVLRGPQGTLFGKNTTGGVINVQRTRPTGELGMRYELTAGTDDRIDGKAVVNFPIVKDRLAGKFGLATFQDGGKMENKAQGGEQVGDLDITDMTATLMWTPGPNLEAVFTYQNYTDETDGIPLLNIADDNADNSVNGSELVCVPLDFCGYEDIDVVDQDFYFPVDFELDAYTLEVDWDLDAGTLTSVTGYRDTTDKVLTDFDSAPISFFHVDRDQDAEQTSQELRFASSDDLSETWDFIAGVYWMKDEYQMRQVNKLFEALGPAALIQSGNLTDHDRESWSVFGEVHFKLAEQWTLTLGGRYTEEDKDYTGTLLVIAPDGSELLPLSSSVDESWDEFTPRVGVDYSLSDTVMLYAVYSEGFRSGGFNARNAVPGTQGPYDPEYVNQYELGMKGDFLEQTLRLNLAVFYTDYEDKQEEFIRANPIQGSVTIVENAADVENVGFEAEATWIANPNLVLNANIGYLDAEFDEFLADGNDDGIIDDLSDLEPRRVPEWTGGVSASYTRQIGMGVFGLNASYRYTDDYWVDASNDPRGLLDSRGVTDLVASYEWEWSTGRTVKVSAYGRDITDEMDRNSAVIIPGLVAFSAVGGGEEYGIQLSGNF